MSFLFKFSPFLWCRSIAGSLSFCRKFACCSICRKFDWLHILCRKFDVPPPEARPANLTKKTPKFYFIFHAHVFIFQVSWSAANGRYPYCTSISLQWSSISRIFGSRRPRRQECGSYREDLEALSHDAKRKDNRQNERRYMIIARFFPEK